MLKQRRAKYLCLQATLEGQASYAHVHEIINGLVRRGWDVELYEPSYAKSERVPGMLGRLWGFISTQARLLFRSKGPYLLYIRGHFATFPVALIAKLRGIHVVQEVNGPYEDMFIAWPWTRRFGALFKRLYRVQLKWADAVITVTPGLKGWVLKEVGHRPIYVIPNGANTSLFRPDAVSSHTFEKPYVVFFGALAPWQGIGLMIKAVQQPRWPKEIRLVVIGDGVERQKVEKAAERDARIVFVGRVPYRDVAGIVAGSIASLSTQNNLSNRSSTGLSPLKVFESIACGVPVIVTDFPGQADLVRENDCGIVIPPDDPDALAGAVAYLNENPEVRAAMGQRGRKAAESSSWDKRAEDTEAVLLSVLDNSACREKERHKRGSSRDR